MTTGDSRPLVSCIMPTHGRPEMLAQALSYFKRQTYPTKELIIVSDGPSRVAPAVDGVVRVVEVPDRRTIGEKRNIACAFARGEIIVHWDDDDWYGPRRIETQVLPILKGRADMTGLACDVLLEAAGMRFWSCTPAEHARLFGDVACGTLAYRSHVWRTLARYPSQNVAEDAAFLSEAKRRGATLHAIRGHGQFVYVRHGSNSWQFEFDRSAWRPTRSRLPREDHRFYASLDVERPALRLAPPRKRRSPPIVSCIMPTADRHDFVALALEYFERQDYPKRELIVVDSGSNSVEELVAGRRNVRYLRNRDRLTLGQLRNVACEAARGSVISHWDDDDWYSPRRLTYQVDALIQSGAQVCGLSSLRFVDVQTQRAWLYQAARGQRWLGGSTLCYWKSAWSLNGFDSRNSGEDNTFVGRFSGDQIVGLNDPTIFLGIIHPGNTSPKHLRAPSWSEIPVDLIRDALGADLPTYLPSGGAVPSWSRV